MPSLKDTGWGILKEYPQHVITVLTIGINDSLRCLVYNAAILTLGCCLSIGSGERDDTFVHLKTEQN